MANLSITTDIREHFVQGFAPGFNWLEDHLPSWRRPRKVRALDTVLELIQHRIKTDPEAALTHADRVLRIVSVLQLRPVGRPVIAVPARRQDSREPREDLALPELEGMAFAVLASCQIALGNTEESLKILQAMTQRPLPAAIRASVFWRRAIAADDCQAWMDAERWVNVSVGLAENADYSTWWETPFRSLPSSLLSRSYVIGRLYEHGLVDGARLEQVATDAVRTAALARDLRFRELEVAALNTLARTGALGAFGGFNLDFTIPPIPRASAQWPKGRWTEALCICSRTHVMTPGAERAYREARAVFLERGCIDDGVQVTIDLQWWLLASGSPRKAAQESHFLLEHLEDSSFDSDLLRSWVEQVYRRHISAELVETVYRELRNLPRVKAPT